MQTTLPLSSIIVEGRLREDLGDIEELAESIRDNGQLQPLVVECILDDTPGSSAYHYALRAGGRRYAALTLLSLNKVPNDKPNFYLEAPVVIFNEMPAHQRTKIELEENLRRKDMNWKEKVVGIVQYHKAAKRAALLDGGKWSQQMTGDLLGFDQASVSIAFKVYEEIKAGNERVIGADSLTDALKIIVGNSLDEAQAEQMRRIQLKRLEQSSSSITPLGTRSISEGVNPSILVGARSAAPDTLVDKLQITKEQIASFYHEGDALEVLPLLAKTTTVNHIICDPPYGIDLANLTRKDMGRYESLQRIADTHTVEGNLELLPAFLDVAFRVIAEDGFLCMFYDLDHHEKIKMWAEKIGWRVTRWPFHWCKTSPCLNNSAQCNITKAVEHCYFFRRSENSIIKTKQARNYIEAGGVATNSHPFVKPKEVWDYLIDTVSTEGQVCVDPFAGEGSSLAAFFKKKRVPIGVEIDPVHIASGLSYIQEQVNKKNILDDILKDSIL